MNLTRQQKQKHVKKVAIAAAVALFQVQSCSSSGATAGLAKLLRDKRIKKGRNPTTSRAHPKWSEVTDDLSDDEFRRIFRMPRGVFQEVCDKVKDRVGERQFKSESYIKELEDAGYKPALMAKAKGGLLSGETKIGVTLRFLAGSSYLDNRLSFKVKFSTHYHLYRDVCRDWLDDDSIFPFILTDMLQNNDIEGLKSLSHRFSMRASDGHFRGCFGAMDGIALKISCPKSTDGVTNPGDYFCQKGFYALNMQAILDPHKRFLWLSSGHIGSCPDARAFPETYLYQLLLAKAQMLIDNGLFLVGDSGYFLRSFLMVPFDRPASKSPRDNFNYFLSNSRIVSECAFGEFILRWGIFWRPLKVKMANQPAVINACARLHNLIVTRRDGLDDPDVFSPASPSASNEEMRFFADSFATTSSEGFSGSEEAAFPLVTDNGESAGAGRPTLEESELREIGVRMREHVCQELHDNGLVRKSKGEPVMNEFGHVYYK